jgi:hypothetical protein
MEGAHVEGLVSPARCCLCRENLFCGEDIDVIGSMTRPAEADRAVATVKMCIGQKRFDG